MTEERRLVTDRLADAISGERREWFRVEVSPDDLATLLAALPQPAAAEPPEDRQALWDKWTGGERLAYGLGLGDGRWEAAQPSAEVERLRAVLDHFEDDIQRWPGPHSAEQLATLADAWVGDLRAALAGSDRP